MAEYDRLHGEYETFLNQAGAWGSGYTQGGADSTAGKRQLTNLAAKVKEVCGAVEKMPEKTARKKPRTTGQLATIQVRG